MKSKECEYDCSIVCVGCDRLFCDIKSEDGAPHDRELVEALTTNSGDHYCHPDCFRDCH